MTNFFEKRVDFYKLIHLSRRPLPRPATDIGAWESILSFMGYVAVLTNMAVSLFTARSTFLEGIDPKQLVIYFVLLEHGIIIMKWGLERLIGSASADVKLQQERCAFFASKLVERTPDEADDDDADVAAAADEGDAQPARPAAAVVVHSADPDAPSATAGAMV